MKRQAAYGEPVEGTRFGRYRLIELLGHCGKPPVAETVYHYVAAMGYDDPPGAWAVWIADSGFWPFGYWCGFDQVATLIPPKGYTYADVAP